MIFTLAFNWTLLYDDISKNGAFVAYKPKTYKPEISPTKQDSCKRFLNSFSYIHLEQLRLIQLFLQFILDSLFKALADAMENLGVDLSQASVTVQVNLGRRAVSGRPNNMSSAKVEVLNRLFNI